MSVRIVWPEDAVLPDARIISMALDAIANDEADPLYYEGMDLAKLSVDTAVAILDDCGKITTVKRWWE